MSAGLQGLGVFIIDAGTDIDEFFFREGVTDGLPVVHPTATRVCDMLAATRRSSAEMIGKCPPSYNQVSVAQVAVCAVMAGCAPLHFRVVLAAVEAILEPNFGLHGNSATTMGATPAIILNGPAREEGGFNCQHGALGSGTRANACVGRAIKLIMQNVGGGKLGGTESTTLGTPMKFTMCVSENDELCSEQGWQPLHVTRGFQNHESVVTVVAVSSGPHQVVDFYTKEADGIIEILAGAMYGAYNIYLPLINECLLVVCPEHVETLKRGGVTSKEELRQRLWKACNKNLAPEIRKLLQSQIGPIKGALVGYPLGMIARAANLITGAGLPFISKFSSPESFHVVVAGGTAGKFSSFCPGFGAGKGGSFAMTQAVSKKVEEAGPLQTVLLPLNLKASDLIDPRATQKVAPIPLANRNGSIAGTIGMMDISKPGGKVILDVLSQMLTDAFPGLVVKRYVKPTFSRPCPDQLRHEIAEACDFFIGALAD